MNYLTNEFKTSTYLQILFEINTGAWNQSPQQDGSAISEEDTDANTESSYGEPVN